MYYEFYIDVFFLVNFLMDFCVLSVSKKILKCPATYRSICLGALIGSLLTCVVVILPLQYDFVKFAISHGLISIFMIKTGLRVKWNRQFLKVYAVVYMSAVLIGGIFSALGHYVREICTFFVAAVFSYQGAIGIWNYINYQAAVRNNSCEVLICNGANRVKVKAIQDTGNRLRDSVTGQPVSIVSGEIAKKVWQDIPITNLRYIPYHTIGKNGGILPVFRVDNICLYLDEELWISNVLIAVSEEMHDTDEYEMILNPDIK